MSTYATHDITTGETGQALVWAVDLHGRYEASLQVWEQGEGLGGVEMYREDVQALIERLTADLHLVPTRPKNPPS